jgi:hypothetical protein
VLAGIACNVTTDASRRVVTYGIAVHPCRPNDCTVPDDTVGITGADRGDTVWVFGFVEGGNPVLGDSALVRLRALCAENLVLLDGAATVRTVPAVLTCPDSTVLRYVGRPPNAAEYRFLQWVVDTEIAPGEYTLEGRMLVPPPDLRPVVTFDVR